MTASQRQTPATPAAPAFSGPELCALQAHEVRAMLATGDICPRDLLDACLARIDAVEPAINAMPTLCPERAWAAAGALDRAQSGHPGWLGGIPLGIKDLDKVAGVRCTMGSAGFADFVPDISDHFVERIEERGGIVVGKTNTPELGAGGNTFNAVFGHTRNPHDTALNAGGSSGGAAAALATGETWLSQGSDHGGSCRTPAAYCGVVGLRTTPGRVATTLAAGASAGFITEGVVGPMARSVRDCALFLDAMAGFEPRVPLSFGAPATPFQQAVIRAGDKVRVAFSPDLNGLCPVEPEIAAALTRALGQLERAGGTVELACPDLSGLTTTYYTLRAMGMATSLSRLPETATRHLKQTIHDNWAHARSLTLDDFADANINRTTLFLRMQALLEDFDVLACPVVGCMPRKAEIEWIDQIGDQRFANYMDWLGFSFLATTTGLPAMSLPVGVSDAGLPIGIQLIGPPRGEARLLAVARAVERAVGGPFAPVDPRVTHA